MVKEIDIYLNEIGFEDAKWIHLPQDSGQWSELVIALMTFRYQRNRTFLYEVDGYQFLKPHSIRKVKVKISLLQAVEAHRAARGQGSHITSTNG
jgi:hypothetical protein